MSHVRQTTETGLLTALIFITGSLKIPGIIPGSEFQLSAPLAVAICAVFGFRQYITAGVLASIMSLALGTQTILNIIIAMVFRLTVGGLLAVGGTSWLMITLAGPIGSTVARLALSLLIGKAVALLVLAAVPGMVYTACTAWSFTVILAKVKSQTERVLASALQR
jgi:hypothetical protein